MNEKPAAVAIETEDGKYTVHKLCLEKGCNAYHTKIATFTNKYEAEGIVGLIITASQQSVTSGLRQSEGEVNSYLELESRLQEAVRQMRLLRSELQILQESLLHLRENSGAPDKLSDLLRSQQLKSDTNPGSS